MSGKGVSGAVFMTLAKAIICEKLMLGTSPADALNQADDELCRQNPEGFLWMWTSLILTSSENSPAFAIIREIFP